jgi:hypothetical protein
MVSKGQYSQTSVVVEEAEEICNVSHNAIFSDSEYDNDVSLDKFSTKYTRKNSIRKMVKLKKPHKIPDKDLHSKAASDSNINSQTTKLEAKDDVAKLVLFRMDESHSHPTEGNEQAPSVNNDDKLPLQRKNTPNNNTHHYSEFKVNN